jgi:DDE superfamily endonuclease
MWCLPQIDAPYLTRMEDVLELYERPHNPQEPVVCLDEKPVSLHGEVRAPQAVRPGVIAKRDSEYKRKGTANVFCAVEPRAGRHFTFPTPRRSAAEFAKVVATIARRYPLAQTIHMVVDNLNIHCQKSLTKHFGPERGAQLWNRFTVHYTPKHGSWLNQAELEIGLFSRQCLGKRRIPDLATLKAEARAWNHNINRKRILIQWNFSRQDARNVFHYQENLFMRSEN